ncbi:MAG: hypothetical protein JSW11_13755 [Candidatus Heimdallarchaeota archaeon]|nr:MAG: hypothetical protein JSW11_13755 [Candidatus Heimdallarchaeota archaeon]
MSQFVTEEVEDQVRGARIAKHVVMRSILKEYMEDGEGKSLDDLMMRIYQLFYDSSMVDALFSDIQEREKQKQELQEMDLEDIAFMAFGEEVGETSSAETEFVSLLEADASTFQSMVALSETIPYEEVYNVMKEANVVIIIDFFSALQGSTSSLWETILEFTDVDKKEILDVFSLFAEKQIEESTQKDDQFGKDLGSSVLNLEVADKSFSIFIYTPAKWLDKGQLHRLSLGLMIQDERAKYVSVMSTHISKKLNEITETILGTTGEDLSNVPFRFVDLTVRKTLRSQVKEIAEYIARCSLALDQIQSSSTEI